MVNNPDLLKKRLNAKEKMDERGIVIKLSGLMFIAGFVVSGLGFRFHWFMLPSGLTAAAAIVFLFCYILYAEV